MGMKTNKNQTERWEYTRKQAGKCVTGNNKRARDEGIPHTLTVEQWLFAINYFGYSCAVCKVEFNDNNMVVLDHWIPISYEGDNNPGTVLWNVIPLCDRCNSNKRARWPDEWLYERYKERIARSIIKTINRYFMMITSDCKIKTAKYDPPDIIMHRRIKSKSYKKCLYCRMRFVAKHRANIYCSDSCQKHAWQQAQGYINYMERIDPGGIKRLEKRLMNLNSHDDENSWLVYDYFDE
jgi:5-methylcytosine-specific restriction endonuclease McrA